MRIKKNIKTLLYNTLTCVLGFVIVLNLVSSNLHELLEHDVFQTEACTAENEQDACHRYVYHHEESSECNGSHQHVSIKQEDCFACNYFKERQQQILINQVKSVFKPNLFTFQGHIYKSKYLSQVQSSFYLRGPPDFN